MLTLGIETAGDRVGVGLADVDGVLGTVTLDGPRRHVERLAPAISRLVDWCGHDMGDLAAIAVDVGPGLFTGLRVGLATGRSMSFALDIPMVGVASLDLVAFPLRYTERRIAVALDARRGEVFWAVYWPVPGGVQRVGEYRCTPPQELASELMADPRDTVLVGTGVARHREAFERLGQTVMADDALGAPSPTSLVELAHARAVREEFVNQRDIEPLYLRPPDAEITWTTRRSEGREPGDSVQRQR